jgi:chromosomal replication initiation ATPase DnaA
MVAIEQYRRATRVASEFAHESSVHSLLLIAGPAGVGKSELARSIVSAATARRCRQVHAISARDLAARFVEAIRRNTFGQILCAYGRTDLVLIEDLNDLRGRPSTLEEIGLAITVWVAAGGRVGCTAGCPVHEIREFTRRLPPAPTSRIVTLGRPTRSEMRSMIQSFARNAGIRLDSQSLADLSTWCNGDIRRAVGAVHQLAFHASVVASR